jgi:hypothetical protein
MPTTIDKPKNYHYLKLKKHTPKELSSTYPGLEEAEVHKHPVIKKKKCPYCNFVNEDGSHKTRGDNFMENVGGTSSNTMFISDDGTIHCHIDDNRNRVMIGYSIKIPYCPFCKRKL